MAAFTAKGHPHALDRNQSNGTPPSTNSEQDASLYEIVVDPQEAESSVSDLLLQLVGTEEGITGLHVESLQKGGVPFQVVTAALSSGWQGLQEQHSKLADIKAQVSMHVVPVKCVLWRSNVYFGGQVCTLEVRKKEKKRKEKKREEKKSLRFSAIITGAS